MLVHINFIKQQATWKMKTYVQQYIYCLLNIKNITFVEHKEKTFSNCELKILNWSRGIETHLNSNRFWQIKGICV